MPGLAIIISSKAPESNRQDLDCMVASIRHESFYVSGTYCDESLGLYVGWACRPGSYGDGMPIRSEDGNFLLFFYGEHLSDPQTSVDRKPSDEGPGALTVLQLFRVHGLDALQRLNGWFHGVLVDVKSREITVFNDRFGMQRLYTVEESGETFFASEAKALLAIRRHLRRLDPRGVGEFLSCGCVLENRSLFEKVTRLPAATVRTFNGEHGSRERYYFKPEQWETQVPLTASEFRDALEEILPRAVQRCLSSRQAIGVSLTGGFDTRLIMACLASFGTLLPSYTFGGMYRDCFDVLIARSVAKICGCSHRVLSLGTTFLQSFANLAEKTVYLSDGCLGATNAYELYLNSLARHVAPVRLTGSYGSEVMRGARAFKAVPPTPGLISPDFQSYIDDGVRNFNALGLGHPISFSVFKQAPWYYANRLTVEQSQVTIRTPFMDNDFVGLFYRRTNDFGDGKILARDLISQRQPDLARLPTDTGNCSFLRHHWAQFLFKADYCYKSGMPQWLEQVHYLLGRVSPERFIIGRHRFAHFRVWFRNQLAPYIKEMLLDRRTAERGYFDPKFVEQMVHRHVKGERNYTDDIERVLTLELTCRQFVDA